MQRTFWNNFIKYSQVEKRLSKQSTFLELTCGQMIPHTLAVKCKTSHVDVTSYPEDISRDIYIKPKQKKLH